MTYFELWFCIKERKISL